MAAKVMIIEDDLIIAENLKENLLELNFQVVGVASNFIESKELFENNTPDICIVDIYLKDSCKNGIEIMSDLQKDKSFPFIYLTSFDDMEYRDRAKTTHPAAYLMKPASKSQIDVAIDFAMTNFRKNKIPNVHSSDHSSCPFVTKENHFFVWVNSRYEKIALNEISYISAAGSYTKIHVGGKYYFVSTGIKNLLEQIATSKIIRSHRSYAVNISKVKAFNDNSLFIISDDDMVDEVPMSNQYKNDIVSLLPKIKTK